MNKRDKYPLLRCTLGVVLLLPLASSASGGKGHDTSPESPSVSDASFQDVTGIITLATQAPANILTKPGGP